MDKLRITGDGILVTEPDKAAEVHASGLYVPPSSQSNVAEVLVVAVGPGVVLGDGSRHKLDVAKGEWILMNRQAGIPIERDGQGFRLIRPHEVLAVIEAEDA